MTYATLTQLKAALRLSDSVDDANLTLALQSAEEMIDSFCGRTFGTAGSATIRYYAPGKPDALEIDDCSNITTVETSVDGTSWTTTTDFQTEPINNLTDGMAWPTTRLRAINNSSWPVWNGRETVRVTAKFAFGAIPTSITQAAILQASRIFTRLSSPLGVAGWNDLGVMRISAGLDVDVQQLLGPYRRIRSAL